MRADAGELAVLCGRSTGPQRIPILGSSLACFEATKAKRIFLGSIQVTDLPWTLVEGLCCSMGASLTWLHFFLLLCGGRLRYCFPRLFTYSLPRTCAQQSQQRHLSDYPVPTYKSNSEIQDGRQFGRATHRTPPNDRRVLGRTRPA